jgi:hypothetical protein
MEKQNFNNHIRYYPPHHFVFYPLIIGLFIIAVRGAIQHSENKWEWIAIAALSVMI